MRKFIKKLFLVLIFVCSLCLVACGKDDKKPDQHTDPDIENPDPEKPNPEPKPDEKPFGDEFACITLAEAVEKATAAGETGTTEKFYVKGTIKNIENTTFGNMNITDGTTTLHIYGVVDKDGNKYETFADKPLSGDQVVLYGSLKSFNGNPEMNNGELMALKHVEIEFNKDDYKELNINAARQLPDKSKVLVKGVVARMTYAFGMVANGFYLVDGTNSITVYSPSAAERVEVGNTVTLAAVKNSYISSKEAALAEKQGYTGAVQLSDVIVVDNDKQKVDFDKTWIKETTVKELISNNNYAEVTGSMALVNALIKKQVNPGFINYYIDDLDGHTGSYVYTSNSGSDFAWLDEFDGKVCKVYLSVINCKSTASGVTRRFVPILVENIDFTYPEKDIPTFIYDYYIKDRIKTEINTGIEIDLPTKAESPVIDLSKAVIEYTSLTADSLEVVKTTDKVQFKGLKEGTAKLQVAITNNGTTLTKEITINVKKAEAVSALTIKQAIDSADKTVVTVKGIVLSSLVNKTGFYLIDETGVIAVTVSSEAIKDIQIGNEVVVKGTRIHHKKETTGPDKIGQSVIFDSEVLSNDYAKHEYKDTVFDKTKTIEDLVNFDVKDDYSTNVYSLQAKVKVIANNYYTSIAITSVKDENVSLLLYCSSANQYEFLKEFDGQEVTLELALCNWNDKGSYKACIISVNNGTKKVMNTVNFTK